jgi:fibronectin type 3 domain-containing protein
VTGICGNVALHALFINYKTSTGRVVSMNLDNDQELWWKDVTPGSDRGDVSIDGTKLYVPGGEYRTTDAVELVLDGRTGTKISQFVLTPKVHDTDVGISGKYAYMETKSSSIVTMVDIPTNTIFRQLRFGDIVGPHVVNGTDTYVVGNVNQWFGFEMVSVATGNVVARVHAEGVTDPPNATPPALKNHAIAWKPDETELWVGSKSDPNLFIFDMTVMPPVQKRRITVGGGYTNNHWITFSIDGNNVYPSPEQNSGTPVQIYDSRTYLPIGTMGYSEKLMEVDIQDAHVVAVGNQYGIGRRTAPPAPPASPTGLSATGGNAQVVLGWTPVAGASSYTVKWSTVPGGGYSPITGIASAGYTHTGLSNGTTYYYVVSAVGPGGESVDSGEVLATPQLPPPPLAPTGLAGTGGNGQVTLGWTASPGASSYTVKWSSTPGGAYTAIPGITGTSYTQGGLSNDTTYYYVLSATGAGGESPDSSEVFATPQMPPPPSAPTGLTAVAGNALVTLTWTASAGATSYTLKRSLTTGGPYTNFVQAGITATGFTNSMLVNGTTYYYVVSATGAGGESPDSSEKAGTPSAPSAPISNLVVRDTATTNPPAGTDGIANSLQWSIQSNFQVNVTAFGDRTVKVTAVPAAASVLLGKAWIRTAADSKNYSSSPLATFMVGSSFVYLAVDNRHNTGAKPAWLDATYTDQGYDITITEGTTARPYSVYRKPVVAGSTVTLPTINATTAPCYIVIVP